MLFETTTGLQRLLFPTFLAKGKTRIPKTFETQASGVTEKRDATPEQDDVPVSINYLLVTPPAPPTVTPQNKERARHSSQTRILLAWRTQAGMLPIGWGWVRKHRTYYTIKITQTVATCVIAQ